jgi:CxxC motif-containing protein (DUF1111 family)
MGAPVPGLTASELARFEAGRTEFAHTLTDSEGLGPVFNDTSCADCHLGPVAGGGSTKFVVRFGIAASGPNPFDHMAALGGSLRQEFSINPPTCDEHVPVQANVQIQRITPPCFGFGLIEAILDADLQVNEAFPPAGVSGKAHLVTPAETPLGPVRIGRFGFKSQVATVLTFSGDASVNELGLSNRLFPVDNSPNGPPMVSQPCDMVADPEDGPDAQGFHRIDRMTDFQRFLAGPPQTPKSGMTGEALFNAVGCNKCHVGTTYTTIPSATETALQNKPLKPYSDFLLHDVGSLGDGIPQGMATETEFRTTPLWGVSVRAPTGLLHDARATGGTPEANLHQAILAHAGEAAATTTAYTGLTPAEQAKVHQFLMSLGRAEFDVDLEANVKIDTIDWFFMRPQVTGPGVFFNADAPIAVADFDQDGDLDLHDIAGFQRAFTGF